VAYQASGRKIPPGERGPASVAVSGTPQARSGCSPSGRCTFASEAGDVAKVFNAVGESNVEILRGVRRVLRRRIKDSILQLLRVIVEHKRNVAAILPRTVSTPLGLKDWSSGCG
jgi:hypothetical protein